VKFREFFIRKRERVAAVDIGTEWNLEDIVPERIVITGWSRYRNRVEFRDYRISF